MPLQPRPVQHCCSKATGQPTSTEELTAITTFLRGNQQQLLLRMLLLLERLCLMAHGLKSVCCQQGSKQGRKNAPICYDFVKGVCKREDCRYSHDLFSIIRGKNSRNGGSPEVCYDFTRCA